MLYNLSFQFLIILTTVLLIPDEEMLSWYTLSVILCEF